MSSQNPKMKTISLKCLLGKSRFACVSCAPSAVFIVALILLPQGVRRVKVAEKVEVLNDDGDLSLFYPIHWSVQL